MLRSQPISGFTRHSNTNFSNSLRTRLHQLQTRFIVSFSQNSFIVNWIQTPSSSVQVWKCLRHSPYNTFPSWQFELLLYWTFFPGSYFPFPTWYLGEWGIISQLLQFPGTLLYFHFFYCKKQTPGCSELGFFWFFV